MVRIRMSRLGRKHRPFFRINAVEKRTPRDGKILEALGWYDPMVKDEAKAVELNTERIKHWLSVGAQPSDTVNDLLAKHGLIDAEAWKQVRRGRSSKKIKDQETAKVAADAAAKVAADAAAKAAAKAAADAAAKEVADAAAAAAAASAEGEKA